LSADEDEAAEDVLRRKMEVVESVSVGLVVLLGVLVKGREEERRRRADDMFGRVCGDYSGCFA
jgi:hypothetical protein